MIEEDLLKPSMVGRDRELKELKTLLDDLFEGKGSAVLISGEAGSGKSHLIDEILREAKSRQAKSFIGTAVMDEIVPFRLFSIALKEESNTPLFHDSEYVTFNDIFAVNRSGLLVAKSTTGAESTDADIFAGMLSAVQDFVRDSIDKTGKENSGIGRMEYGDMKIIIEHGDYIYLTAVFKGTEHPNMREQLRRAMEDIENRHGKLIEGWSGNMKEMVGVQEIISTLGNREYLVKRDISGIKLDNERTKIASRVMQMLKRESEKQPIVMILEDVQWADESSIFIINYLLRNAKKFRMLLLLSYRPEEAGPLKSLINDALQNMDANKISVPSLDKASIIELLDEIFEPNSFPETFKDNLFQRCDGNPLFILEVLKSMLDEGNITLKDGTYYLEQESYEFPSSIQDIIQIHLDSLMPNAIALSEYLSCIGKEFYLDVASSINTIEDSAKTFRILDSKHIIVLHGGSGRFNHSIFQEVLYDGINDRWKAKYHGMIADYYEDSYSDKKDEVMYHLAKHFSKARQPEKAFDYSIKAAEMAESAFAAEEALKYYDMALESMPLLKHLNEKEERIKLYMNKVNMLRLIGKMDEVTELIKESISIARELDDETLIADMKMTMAAHLSTQGETEKVKMLCDESISTYQKTENREGFMKFYSTMGHYHFKRGEYDKSNEFHMKEMAIASELGDENNILSALSNLGPLYWQMRDYDRGKATFEKIIQLSMKLGEMGGMISALNGLGLIHWNQGNFEGAMECFRDALRESNEIKDIIWIGVSSCNVGLIHVELNEHEEAMKHYQKYLQISEEIGNKDGMNIALGNIGDIHLYAGNYEKALDYYSRKLEIAREQDNKRGICYSLGHMGMAKLEQECLEDADALFSEQMKTAKILEDKLNLAEAHHNIGILNLKQNNLETAKNEIQTAIDIAQELSIKPYLLSYLGSLINLYIKSKDMGLARTAAKRALSIAKELNVADKIEDIENTLAGIE